MMGVLKWAAEIGFTLDSQVITQGQGWPSYFFRTLKLPLL